MFAIVNYSNITTASSYYSFLITKQQVSEELWGGWESIVPSGIDSGEVGSCLGSSPANAKGKVNSFISISLFW